MVVEIGFVTDSIRCWPSLPGELRKSGREGLAIQAMYLTDYQLKTLRHFLHILKRRTLDLP